MKNSEILAQAKFIQVDGHGLMMPICEFNELISRFELVFAKTPSDLRDLSRRALEYESRLKRALRERRDLSNN